jgi:hypothetical protein
MIHRTILENGEVIETPFTKEEIAEVMAAEKRLEKELAENKAKETARQEILDRIGLSADEAKLLLG